MKTIFALFILFFTATPFMQAQTKKVIFYDDFSSNKNKWLSDTSSNISYLVYNGKYVIDAADSLLYNITKPVAIDATKDYSISLTVTHTSGIYNTGYGISFGGSDINNYFSFSISNNGYFRLDKNSTAGYTQLVPWTTSPAIKQGNYVDNIMELSKEGSNWKLFINNQLVTTVPAVTLMGNLVGLQRASDQRVEYDDLKVMQ